MVIETLLTGSRWEILQELARKPQSTSQLAKALKTTSAHISQQLKQLEIGGIVTRKRAVGKRVHYTYSIVKDVFHLTHIGPRAASKKTYSADPMATFIAALTTFPHATPLLTFLLSRPLLTNRFIAIGVLKRDQPELFVLAQQVEDIRQNHANTLIDALSGQQRVVLWSHTVAEVEQGLARNDTYFYDALKEITLTYDPQLVLHKLMLSLGEHQ